MEKEDNYTSSGKGVLGVIKKGMRSTEHLFSKVKHFNVSISPLGAVDQLSSGSLDMLKDLTYNSSFRTNIIK